MQFSVSNYQCNKRNFKRKNHQKLGAESLQQRIKNRSPSYLFQLVPVSNTIYSTGNSHNILQIHLKHNFFKNSFFPSTISERNNLDPYICNSETFFLKSNIMKSIQPKQNSIRNCHNPKGIRLITRLQLGLSHLCEHKFKHSF